MWRSCVVLLVCWAVGILGQVQTKLSYVLEEEGSAGALVGDIGGDSRLLQEYPDAFDNLEFSVLSQTPDLDPPLFTLSQAGGELRTAGRIDRDAVCPNKASCTIQLNVKVDPPQYFNIIQVTILITDLNDNIPSFPETLIQRSLPESSKVGSRLPLPSAVDRDSPELGVRRYSLSDPTNTFSIQVVNDSNVELYLVLQKDLDRETKDSYKLGLVAYDGYGSSAQSGTATVSVTVQDVNDHSPVFEKSTYGISVQEPVEADAYIGRIQAEDRDSGENAAIVYSIVDQGSLPFIINASTGDIFSTQALDHELQGSYSFTAQARDRGETSLPGSTRVTVLVQDINDNAPVIAIQGQIGPSHVVTLQEGSGPGTFVAHITVSDADSGTNGQFACTLSIKDFRLEKLFESEFKIVTKVTLDRESVSRYDVKIECRDAGSPVLSAEKSLTVLVSDVNDNPPDFSQSVYLASVLENSLPGTTIYTVTAADPDVGDNGAVLYSLAEEAQTNFSVDAVSGDIQTMVSFDREEVERVQFRIYAVDLGEDFQHTSTATVIVDVMDVNDEAPTFIDAEYTLAVYENQVPGTLVGQVEARDKDKPPFNNFLYSLMDPDNTTATLPFEMDPYTGKIWTTASLDREARGEYQLKAYATSSVGLNPMSGMAAVRIYVADKNDNSPILLFPQEYNNTQYISNLPRGSPVTQLNATDRDSGQNSMLSYFIEGQDAEFFEVDESTGAVMTKDDLSRYSHKTFLVRVVVRDHGVPPRTAESLLSVVVNKSIPYEVSGSLVSKHNLTIVVVIACVSAVVMVMLVVAIAAIWFVHRRTARKHRKLVLSKQLLVLSQPSHDTPAPSPGFKPRETLRSSYEIKSKITVRGQTGSDRIEAGNLRAATGPEHNKQLPPKVVDMRSSMTSRRPPPKPPRGLGEQEEGIVTHKPPIAPNYSISAPLIPKEYACQRSSDLPADVADCCSSGGSEGSDMADSGRGSSDDVIIQPHLRVLTDSKYNNVQLRRLPSDNPPSLPPKRGSIKSGDLSPGYHVMADCNQDHSSPEFATPVKQTGHNYHTKNPESLDRNFHTPGKGGDISFQTGNSGAEFQSHHGTPGLLEHGSYV